MIEQISIYTENRRGAAREILSIFSKLEINVLSLVNSDSGEFGTMRLIVSDTAAAMEELKNQGYLCKTNYVLAAELDDVPGSLESFLTRIEDMNINISYMYVGYMRANKTPVIIFHCNDMDIVESVLQNNGYILY